VLLYAAFFAAVAHNDHLALWGLFAGALHGLLGGVVVGAFVDLHPRMPHEVPAPGVFYRHYGRRASRPSSPHICGWGCSPQRSMPCSTTIRPPELPYESAVLPLRGRGGRVVVERGAALVGATGRPDGADVRRPQRGEVPPCI
jgi:hypothetical protein